MFVRRVSACVGAVACAFSLIAAPASGAPTSVNLPASIDASGRTDVTQALEQFLASVPAGSTVEFPHDGKFDVEGVLRLKGVKNLTLDGNGAQLFAQTDGSAVTPPEPRYRAHWPRLRTHVEVQDADTLTVRDLDISGPNHDGKFDAAFEGQAGFTVVSSSNVTLDDVSVKDTYGDGVYVAGKSEAVTVSNSTFDHVGRQGVAIVNASNVVVTRDRIQNVARSAVDLEPAVPKWTVTGVHITENQIGNYANFALAAGGAGPGVNDIWFQDNHITGGNGIAVYAGMPRWPRQGLHIIGNVSDVNGRVVGTGRGGVMQIVGTSGVEIVGNHQRVDSGAAAVTLAGVCNVVMRDNAFPGATQDQQVVAACGAKLAVGRPNAPAPKGGGAKSTGAKKSGAGAGASAAAGGDHGGSVSVGWLVIGYLAGALTVLGLGAVVWRARRQTPT